MSNSMFREIKDGEDVTDIVTNVFLFLTIPAIVFAVSIALWKYFMTM